MAEIDGEGRSRAGGRAARAGRQAGRGPSEADQEFEDEGGSGDNVREYLRSIGKHKLLTAPQEIELGLAVGRWLQLREVRDDFAAGHQRQPLPQDLGGAVYRALPERAKMLASLASAVGEDVAGADGPELLLRPALETRWQALWTWS